MTSGELTTLLAQRVMGWKVAPDRYIKPGRSWIPRWRFMPFERLDDAFQVLEQAAHRYVLSADQERIFTAVVRVGRRTGKASGKAKAWAITAAVARALGLEV